MADMNAGIAPFSVAALTRRLVRYADLAPCYNAFIDCRTPGSEAKENFTIIGPGVSENPHQHVHIAESHGYNIGGARQPPGCVNSQHSHDTAEVFVVHTGHWRFDLGEHGTDAQVELAPGDVISIPTRIFRGFTATKPHDDGSPGFLWAVLGEDDPGRVTWAPQVFEMARDYGLVLLENGSLIDTAVGEAVPDGIAPMRPTSRAEAESLVRLDAAAAAKIVARDLKASSTATTQIIGENAMLGWDHGFQVTRVDIATGDGFEWPGQEAKEIMFVHRGSAALTCADGPLELGLGDTISLPQGLGRRVESPDGATLFLVRK